MFVEKKMPQKYHFPFFNIAVKMIGVGERRRVLSSSLFNFQERYQYISQLLEFFSKIQEQYKSCNKVEMLASHSKAVGTLLKLLNRALKKRRRRYQYAGSKMKLYFAFEFRNFLELFGMHIGLKTCSTKYVMHAVNS